MPPISSSRLAPLITCNSPAASIWPSQVRRSCLGALMRPWDENSAARFMFQPFRDPIWREYESFRPACPANRSPCVLQCPIGHGPNQVAPIVGAVIGVFHGLDRLGGGLGSRLKGFGP